MNKNIHNNEQITTTTKKLVEEKVLIDELTNISIKINDNRYFEKKLNIKKVENVKIEEIEDINIYYDKSLMFRYMMKNYKK